MYAVQLPPTAALESAAIEMGQGADYKRGAAIAKALYDLLTLKVEIIAVQGAFLVPSSSRAGIIHRVDHVQGCSCEAGRKGLQCRHAVALELIENAAQHTMPALARPSYNQALAAVNELFA